MSTAGGGGRRIFGGDEFLGESKIFNVKSEEGSFLRSMRVYVDFFFMLKE
jgi:hypothetical protein